MEGEDSQALLLLTIHYRYMIQAMNLARSIAVVLGWFLVSLRPSTDLLYKHLKKLNSSDRMKHAGSRIEIVKMA